MTAPQQTRPTLAVVAICKNEERDLPGFFANVLPWVDEIILVDDGSTDRTLAIARAIGPKVRLIAKPMDSKLGFAGQRNAGTAAATAEWVLQMDIDERVTPELAAEIQQAICEPGTDAYRFRRLDFSLHRPLLGRRRRWNQIHLMRRGVAEFKDRVHEQCVLDTPATRVGQLQGFMWHLRDVDFVERLGKNLLYAQAEAARINERRIRVRWYHLLLHPLRRSLRCYFFDGCFRDGVVGMIDALYVFTGTFNWYAIAWDQQNRIRRELLEENMTQLWRSDPTRR